MNTWAWCLLSVAVSMARSDQYETLGSEPQTLVYDEDLAPDKTRKKESLAGGCVVAANGKVCGGPKHGVCAKHLDLTPFCHCNQGWGDKDCTRNDCPEDAQGNLCHNQGTCVKAGFRGHKCECIKGWKGKDCEVPDVCPGLQGPFKKECSGHGRCGKNRFDKRKCFCHGGWGHRDCSFPYCLQNIAEALPGEKPAKQKTMCSSKGKCVRTAFNHHHCKCEKFWCGKDCHKACLCSPSCGEHGKCILMKGKDGKMRHKCKCEKGWTGPSCLDRTCPKCGKHKKMCGGHGLCTLCDKSKYNKKTHKCSAIDNPDPKHVVKFSIIGEKGKHFHHHHKSHGFARRRRGVKKKHKREPQVSLCHCDPGWTGECCEIPTCPLGCAPANVRIPPKAKGKECWEKCHAGEKHKEHGNMSKAESALDKARRLMPKDTYPANTQARAGHQGCSNGFCGKWAQCCRQGVIHPGGFPYGACDGNSGSPQRHICAVNRVPCGWHIDQETGKGVAHGKCLKSGKGYKCKCKKGWTGPSCCVPETAVPTPAPTATRAPTRTPAPTQKPTSGPTHKPSTRAPTKVDPCSKMNCKPHAHCVEGPPPHCECDTKINGECLVQHYGPKCLPCPDCGPYGQCNEGVKGDGKCKCHFGYTGKLCNECHKDLGFHQCSNSTVCTQKKCPGQACGTYTHMDDRFNNWECVGLNCEFHCRSDRFGTCTNCYQGNCRCGKVPFEKDMAKGVLAEKMKYPKCDECPVGTFGRKCQKITIKCEHGTPSSGKYGTGKCDCHDGYTGPTCSSCVTGYFQCKDKSGKAVCSGMKCEGSACGENTNEKPSVLDWECSTNWCSMHCSKTVFNKCDSCHGGNCQCRNKGGSGTVTAP